jgi:hypothetical protein
MDAQVITFHSRLPTSALMKEQNPCVVVIIIIIICECYLKSLVTIFGCHAVWSAICVTTFQRNLLPQSQGWMNMPVSQSLAVVTLSS